MESVERVRAKLEREQRLEKKQVPRYARNDNSRASGRAVWQVAAG
jgi:hypothetical protein